MEGLDWLEQVKWDADGLVPVIAQEQGTKDVLMFAWMNREALAATAAGGQAVYFSRSRQRLWHKGEESGHFQEVHSMRLDCDADVVLLTVTQHGHEPSIACHTGRHSCFFQRLGMQVGDGQVGDRQASGGQAGGQQWQTVEPVLKDPESIYR